MSSIVEKEVIDGKVIAMNKREVVVNIGFKSDGIISLNEFRYNPDLKVGDTVEVYVESQEDQQGQLSLSHKKVRALRSWDRVNEALDKDEIIKGFVKCRTKGGMIGRNSRKNFGRREDRSKHTCRITTNCKKIVFTCISDNKQ